MLLVCVTSPHFIHFFFILQIVLIYKLTRCRPMPLSRTTKNIHNLRANIKALLSPQYLRTEMKLQAVLSVTESN